MGGIQLDVSFRHALPARCDKNPSGQETRLRSSPEEQARRLAGARRMLSPNGTRLPATKLKQLLYFLTRRSLALRLAIASALFGLVVVGGATAVGFWTLSNQLDERSEAEMEGRRRLLTHILLEVPSRQVIGESSNRFGELFYGHDDLHLAILEAGGGDLIAGFSEIGVESVAALRRVAARPSGLHTWRRAGGQRFSGIHGTAALADGSQVDFYLSVDRARDTRLLGGFLQATFIALPLLLIVVALGAGLITRTGLAPLRRFNQLAASIGTKSLNRRLSVAGLPVELAATAAEFNAMLERIDEGYRKLEDFAGDLAHEMRTPVATLLGRTQVALSRNRSGDELRAVLEGNVDELERLSTLIGDMLFIARAEHNVATLDRAAVDLVLEARRVAEYLSGVAEDRALVLDVRGSAPTLQADRLMIQRAITNLLSNAIRHAEQGSRIEIDVGSAGTLATLAVSNVGDVISTADQERIFERFYRVDQARARGQGGSGLGLAIVRSIATLHGGTIAVASAAGRTTFTLSLPLANAANR